MFALLLRVDRKKQQCKKHNYVMLDQLQWRENVLHALLEHTLQLVSIAWIVELAKLLQVDQQSASLVMVQMPTQQVLQHVEGVQMVLFQLQITLLVMCVLLVSTKLWTLMSVLLVPRAVLLMRVTTLDHSVLMHADHVKLVSMKMKATTSVWIALLDL